MSGARPQRPGNLLEHHDVILADLDGTLYRGRTAIPGAVETVSAAARRGVSTAYITNNASRGPVAVAAHLTELGFPARAQDVATSAQAAAALLGRCLPAGSTVLVVGTDALVEELVAVGLRPVREAAGVAAVVQGHDPATAWPLLAEATIALRSGAAWVACNLDATLPTERGLLPGNGAMVAALRAATGRSPDVAGKPAPALMQQAVARTGALRPLVVGDRLDTDIAAGKAAGLPTLLVLSGVCDAAGLLAAPPSQRPDHVGADLTALARDPASGSAAQPGWTAEVLDQGVLRLAATAGRPDPLDALRALCSAHWATGSGGVRIEAADDTARDAIGTLRLDLVSAGAAPAVGAHDEVSRSG